MLVSIQNYELSTCLCFFVHADAFQPMYTPFISFVENNELFVLTRI